jgi:hypothetical protein
MRVADGVVPTSGLHVTVSVMGRLGDAWQGLPVTSVKYVQGCL